MVIYNLRVKKEEILGEFFLFLNATLNMFFSHVAAHLWAFCTLQGSSLFSIVRLFIHLYLF